MGRNRRYFVSGASEANIPQIFSLPKNIFGLLSLRRANREILGDNGGKECMYIKDWFKALFPTFYLEFFVN